MTNIPFLIRSRAACGADTQFLAKDPALVLHQYFHIGLYLTFGTIVYEWRAPEVGQGYDEQIQDEIRKRQGYIWDIDLPQAIADAGVALEQSMEKSRV